jgi:hypothetical protein
MKFTNESLDQFMNRGLNDAWVAGYEQAKREVAAYKPRLPVGCWLLLNVLSFVFGALVGTLASHA